MLGKVFCWVFTRESLRPPGILRKITSPGPEVCPTCYQWNSDPSKQMNNLRYLYSVACDCSYSVASTLPRGELAFQTLMGMRGWEKIKNNADLFLIFDSKNFLNMALKFWFLSSWSWQIWFVAAVYCLPQTAFPVWNIDKFSNCWDIFCKLTSWQKWWNRIWF